MKIFRCSRGFHQGWSNWVDSGTSITCVSARVCRETVLRGNVWTSSLLGLWRHQTAEQLILSL